MKKIKQNNQAYTSPEFDPYQPDNVPLFEALYGKDLISLGNLAAIDNMFSRINIKGLKALDLGFGLGGVAFYLAEKYQMSITGIEVHSWMVQYAKKHTPTRLSNLLEFNTYNDIGQFPYKPETFDLVYSKGVLNHIADKATLFRQIHSVLKLKGLFVIADWIFPKTVDDSASPLVCETKESYEQVLVSTGFSEIKFRDDSKSFLVYINELLKNLTNNRDLINQKYGEELFLVIQKQHEELIDKINQHQKIAIRIVAEKT